MLHKTSAIVWGVCLIAAAASGLALAKGDHQKQGSTRDPAVERTRKTVRMVDDLYKTAVVLITDKYVNDVTDFPAGSAAKALFASMKQKGWHEVRLLDATGEPTNPENSPRDEFERQAVRQLKAGKNYYDQVVVREGDRYLRAATPVPVVLKKCTMCHENYKDVAPGRPIGALSYTVRIEDAQ